MPFLIGLLFLSLVAPCAHAADDDDLELAAGEPTAETEAKADNEGDADLSLEEETPSGPEPKSTFSSPVNHSTSWSDEAGEVKTKPDTSNMTRLELVNYHRDLIHNAKELKGYTVGNAHQSKEWKLSVGGLGYSSVSGVSPVWGFVSLEYASDSTLAVDMVFRYYGYNIDTLIATNMGGSLGLSYYPRDTYDGLNLKIAAGLASTSYTVNGYSGNGTSWLASAAIGWRWMLGNLLTLGLHLGAEYHLLINVQGNAASTTSLTGNTILPTAYLDFGLVF